MFIYVVMAPRNIYWCLQWRYFSGYFKLIKDVGRVKWYIKRIYLEKHGGYVNTVQCILHQDKCPLNFTHWQCMLSLIELFVNNWEKTTYEYHSLVTMFSFFSCRSNNPGSFTRNLFRSDRRRDWVYSNHHNKSSTHVLHRCSTNSWHWLWSSPINIICAWRVKDCSQCTNMFHCSVFICKWNIYKQSYSQVYSCCTDEWGPFLKNIIFW